MASIAARPAQGAKRLVGDIVGVAEVSIVGGIWYSRAHANMKLDLIDGWWDGRNRQDILQVPLAVVADADRPRFPRMDERLHGLPIALAKGGRAGAFTGSKSTGHVQQKKIDAVEAHLLEILRVPSGVSTNPGM